MNSAATTSGNTALTTPASQTTTAAQATGTASLSSRDQALVDKLVGAIQAAQSAASSAHAQRLWAEVCALFSRITSQRKHNLCSFVSSEPLKLFTSIVQHLVGYLDVRYINATCSSVKFEWLHAIAQLHNDGVLELLSACCNAKTAVMMMPEGKQLAGAAVSMLIPHLGKLTQVYVEFTDWCVQCVKNKESMRAATLSSAKDIMNLIHVCAHDAACAQELLRPAEPAALVTRLMYGIKLRSQRTSLFRPNVAADDDDVSRAASSSAVALQNSGLTGTETDPASSVHSTPHQLTSPLRTAENSTVIQAAPMEGSNSTAFAVTSTNTTTTGVATASPPPSSLLLPVPIATFVPTEIDSMHEQALSVLVLVLRHQKSLSTCASSAAVITNLCSYIAVNVNMAEPESTPDEHIAILANVLLLLRTIRDLLNETFLDNRTMVIEELLKEQGDESVLNLVRVLLVRLETYASFDHAIMSTMKELLQVGSHPLPLSSSTSAHGGHELPSTSHAVTRESSPPMLAAMMGVSVPHRAKGIADRVRTLLGASVEPLAALPSILSGSPTQPVGGGFSVSSSAAGPNNASSGDLAVAACREAEHRLHRAVVSIFVYFVRLNTAAASVRCRACECLLQFCFGGDATLHAALPDDIIAEPIAFFLTVVQDQLCDDANFQTLEHARFFVSTLHGIDAIFNTVQTGAVQPRHVAKLCGWLLHPVICAVPVLLMQLLQTCLAGIKAMPMDLETELIIETVIEDLLSRIVSTASFRCAGNGGQTRQRHDGGLSFAAQLSLSLAPNDLLTTPSHQRTASDAEKTPAFNVMEQILDCVARTISLLLERTRQKTSESFVRCILSMVTLTEQQLSTSTTTAGAGATLAASPISASVPFSDDATAEDLALLSRFADRCLKGLFAVRIPTAFPLFVDTLSNPQLTAAFLPYLFRFMFDNSSESEEVRELFLAADGLNVAATIAADVLREGDDLSLLYQLFRLFSAFVVADEASADTDGFEGDGMASATSSANASPSRATVDASSILPTIARLIDVATCRDESQIFLAQAILDAATGHVFSTEHEASTQNFANFGPFRLRQPNCAAEKPFFLDLIPRLLSALEASSQSETATSLLDALFAIADATGQISSTILLRWVLEKEHTRLLRHLYLPLEVIQKLPFADDARSMLKFWGPLLSQAPRRSELRFHSSGGITVTVDSWPEAGLTVSAWFKFHEVYPVIPLFELLGMGENNVPVNDAVLIDDGETISVMHQAATSVTKKRDVMNENSALDGLDGRRWLHFSLVVSPARVMTLYFHGQSVGHAEVSLLIAPRTKAQIHIGFVTKQRDQAVFSIGDVQLWFDELPAPAVLSDYCESDPQRYAPKILPTDVPREMAATTTSGILSVVASSIPIKSRAARFVPHYTFGHRRTHMRNLVGDRSDVFAEVVQRRILPPRSFIHFHRLFLSRGGLRYLADWISLSGNEGELVTALQLFSECVRSVQTTETMRPRVYVLAAYFLKLKGNMMTVESARALIRLAVVQVPVNAQPQHVLINRLAMDHIFADLEVVAEMKRPVALVLIQELSRLFDVATNRYARRNFDYTLGARAFDRILNGLVRVSLSVSRAVQMAVIDLLKKMIVASDFSREPIGTLMHIAAAITPQTMEIEGRNQHRCMIAVESRICNIPLPLRVAHFLSYRLLQMLTELLPSVASGTSASQPGVANVAQQLASLMTVGWYMSIVNSRFACSQTVVLATRLLVGAVPLNAELAADLQRHIFAVCGAIVLHVHEPNVVLILLAASAGMQQKINLAESSSRSLLKQLDDVIESSKLEAGHSCITSMYAAVLVGYLQKLTAASSLQPNQRLRSMAPQLGGTMKFGSVSWRVRRFFSAVFVIGKLMLPVNAKRVLRRRKFVSPWMSNHRRGSAAMPRPRLTEASTTVTETPFRTRSPTAVFAPSLMTPLEGGRDLTSTVELSPQCLQTTIGPRSLAARGSTPRDGSLPTPPHLDLVPLDHSLMGHSATQRPMEPHFLEQTLPLNTRRPSGPTLTPEQQQQQQRQQRQPTAASPNDLNLQVSQSERPFSDDVAVVHSEERPDEPSMEELLESGTIRPFSELKPHFRRAMTLLRPIILLHLDMLHNRYDGYNNSQKLRKQGATLLPHTTSMSSAVVGTVGSGGGGGATSGSSISSAKEDSAEEVAHFALATTKKLLSQTHLFPNFAVGVIHSDTLAFLAAQNRVSLDRLTSDMLAPIAAAPSAAALLPPSVVSSRSRAGTQVSKPQAGAAPLEPQTPGLGPSAPSKTMSLSAMALAAATQHEDPTPTTAQPPMRHVDIPDAMVLDSPKQQLQSSLDGVTGTSNTTHHQRSTLLIDSDTFQDLALAAGTISNGSEILNYSDPAVLINSGVDSNSAKRPASPESDNETVDSLDDGDNPLPQNSYGMGVPSSSHSEADAPSLGAEQSLAIDFLFDETTSQDGEIGSDSGSEFGTTGNRFSSIATTTSFDTTSDGKTRKRTVDISESALDLLNAAITTSLKIPSTHPQVAANFGASKEVAWMLEQYGTTGTLLVHVLTSFFGTTGKSLREDALTVTLLFCSAVYRYIATEVVGGTSNNNNTGGSGSTVPQQPSSSSSASLTGGEASFVAGPATSSSAAATTPAAANMNNASTSAPSAASSYLPQLSEVAVNNLLQFVTLLCDRVVTSMLLYEPIAPFLTFVLRVASRWPNQTNEFRVRKNLTRIAVILLTRPETPCKTVDYVADLLAVTLKREWDCGSQLEELIRAVYQIGRMPQVNHNLQDQMQLATARVWRVICTAYAGTMRLKRAFTGKTITQTVSLVSEFQNACGAALEDSAVFLAKLLVERHEDVSFVMNLRPKVKHDEAIKREHHMKNAYQSKMPVVAKNRNEVHNFSTATSILEKHWSSFGSAVNASLPTVDATTVHWVLFFNAVLSEREGQHGSSSSSSSSSTPLMKETLHYFDSSRNYVPFHLVCDVNAEEQEGSCADDQGSATTTTTTSSNVKSKDAAKLLLSRTASVVDASINEEQVSLVSIFLPPLVSRCPPIMISQSKLFWSSENNGVTSAIAAKLTDSAKYLLRFLLAPGEKIRHLCNVFRISGIQATPCLAIVTDAMLKLFASTHINAQGDLIMGTEDEGSGSAFGDGTEDDTASPALSPEKKGALARFASRTRSVTLRLRGAVFGAAERKREHGTKLAKSLHASHRGSKVTQGLCWHYYLNNVSRIQKVQYLHQDCGVFVTLAHDDGPFIAVMDEEQSLNSDARDAFFREMKNILGDQAEYLDEATKKDRLNTVTEMWVQRSCSTFEYLHFVNAVASRLRKDWNQYPIFPWIIKDYVSDVLSMDASTSSSPSSESQVFRDLSLPIGAQLDERRAELKRRYDTLAEEQQHEEEERRKESEEKGIIDAIVARVEKRTGATAGGTNAGSTWNRTVPFHYGSHYSSSGGVLYFLIRAEPFSTRSKIFQGGSFDHADRLFANMAECYRSCTLGPADCKELLPEFYSRGEFLKNTDRLPLGTRQDGTEVNDVSLPPWAQGSTQVFIALMRMALESDYTSQHLHAWLDLIFGVRQRGKLGVESFNVYQRFTYGEEVRRALLSANTTAECHAIVAEVENFGQTPVQLFQEPHPRRSVPFVSSHGDVNGPPAASHGGSDSNNNSGSMINNPTGTGLISSSGSQDVTGPAALLNTGAGNNSSGTAATPSAAAFTTLSELRLTKAQIMLTYAWSLMEEDSSSPSPSSASSFAVTTEAVKTPVLTGSTGDTPTNTSVPLSASSVFSNYRQQIRATHHFVLKDVPASISLVPLATCPSPVIAKLYRDAARQEITSFERLHDGRWFPNHSRIRAVPETNQCLCWHEHEKRLLRYDVHSGEFHSMVQFELPTNMIDVHITSLSICRREMFLFVGTGTGTVYALHPDSVRTWCVLGTTMCLHTHAIKISIVSERLCRLITTTNSPDDFPIVWRIQRLSVAFLHRLPLNSVFPETDRVATAVSLCPRDGIAYVAATRRVALFDESGEPMGVGTLPSPSDIGSKTFVVYSDITAIHHFMTCDWCEGRIAIFTGHQDGSIGLWVAKRLPPSQVKHNKIVEVKFWRTICSSNPAKGGGMSSSAAVSTMRQTAEGVPQLLVGFSNGDVKEFAFEEVTPLSTMTE